MSKIVRYRGDTPNDRFNITKEDGSVQDITGFSFVLTINSRQDPTDTSTQLLQIVGVVVDASNGVVDFFWTPVQADQAPGVYYYDVEMVTNNNHVKTVVKGMYEFLQDIGKVN